MDNFVYFLIPKTSMLLASKEAYMITSFRVKDLSDNDKISLIMDGEKYLRGANLPNLKLSLLWQSGIADAGFRIWNERFGIKKITNHEKVELCSKSELLKFPINKHFDDDDYVERGMYQILFLSESSLEKFRLA